MSKKEPSTLNSYTGTITARTQQLDWHYYSTHATAILALLQHARNSYTVTITARTQQLYWHYYRTQQLYWHYHRTQQLLLLFNVTIH